MCVFLGDPLYKYPKMVESVDETHGGEDVMVFARGPWAHLFSGNYEQNLIPLTMGFAAGVGPAAGMNGGPVAYAYAPSRAAAVPSSLFAITGGFLLTTIALRRVCS
jgi:alkaline phosphatase